LNPWLLLTIAGLFEVGWALGLNASDGFTKPLPSVLTVLGALASFILLERAMRSLPVGTAYAVWTGIGALGTASLAVLFFQEPLNALRVAGVLAIVAGIALLKLA
jgi:quaternary ammonium compound-resistance protein SugE